MLLHEILNFGGTLLNSYYFEDLNGIALITSELVRTGEIKVFNLNNFSYLGSLLLKAKQPKKLINLFYDNS